LNRTQTEVQILEQTLCRRPNGLRPLLSELQPRATLKGKDRPEQIATNAAIAA
jgi:hypothetical protein